MGRRGVSIAATVMNYLDRHMGMRVYTATMAEELGMTKDQVTGAIYRLLQRKDFPVTRIAEGVYEVRPKSSSKRIFEELGRSKKDGTLIIEADDGTLYKATEL